MTLVAIGIPSGDLVHADFAMALANMVTYSVMNNVKCVIVNVKTSIIEVSRNTLIDSARQYKADYLMMLDSDMVFPYDALLRLILREKDFICTDAVRRIEPHTTVVKGLNNKPLNHNLKEELVEIMGMSPACCLIRMDALKEFNNPMFVVEFNGKNSFLGEDYYFSNLIRKQGKKIWCDMVLSKEIGHIGSKAHYIKS